MKAGRILDLRDFDHGFDDSRFRFGQHLEIVDHGVKRCSMSHPRIGVDRAFFDQFDDASKIGRQSIAAGFERDFWLVQCGVQKGNFLSCNSNVHETACLSHIVQRVGHRFVASGRICDNRIPVAVGDLVNFCQHIRTLGDVNCVIDAVRLATEFEAIRIHIHHRDGGFGQASKF